MAKRREKDRTNLYYAKYKNITMLTTKLRYSIQLTKLFYAHNMIQNRPILHININLEFTWSKIS